MKIKKYIKKSQKIWDKYTEGWVGSLVYVILGFVIAYSMNIALGFALSTDTPVVAVVSYSMVPTLDKGDMIIVQGGEIKAADIIVYDVAGQRYPIIHRVIKVNSDGTLETKGDNNPSQLWFEHNIKSQQIHGKLVLRIPILGWVKIGTMQVLGLL